MEGRVGTRDVSVFVGEYGETQGNTCTGLKLICSIAQSIRYAYLAFDVRGCEFKACRLSWKFSVFEIPLGKELTAKLKELIPAVMVKY